MPKSHLSVSVTPLKVRVRKADGCENLGLEPNRDSGTSIMSGMTVSSFMRISVEITSH